MNDKGNIQLPLATTITTTDHATLLKEVVRASLHNITPNGLLNGIVGGILAYRADLSNIPDEGPRQVLTHIQVKRLFAVLIDLEQELVSQDEKIPHT